jgi:hypothetical protein
MAATYDLTRDFDSGDELTQQAPYWVVGIVRFAHQATYDPQTRASISESDDLAMEERDPPLVLTSEVTQMRVASSKDSHVSNLGLNITAAMNMLTEAMPGDWVVGCMLNSETQGKKVAQAMREKKAINGWKDGLKFLGKVSGCRKAIAAAPNGTIRTSYSVQAVGFGEFDSLLFFHPQLQQQNALPASLEQFGTLIKDIVSGTDRSVVGNAVDINKVLPKLVEVVFGQGAWNSAPGILSKSQGAISASPNTRYLVPATVFKWLGLERAKTYNDLLYVLTGVQHYRTVENASGNTDGWTLFQPDGLTADDNGDVLRTPVPLIGWFPLSAPPMQASVWDLLSGYTNPPLNEMYIALKADSEGDIFPHLVVRQTPYTSPAVRGAISQWKGEAEAEKARLSQLYSQPSGRVVPPLASQDADATDFLELPRWKLPNTPGRIIIHSADIGRSDGLRFNMVHVSGTGMGTLTDEVGSFLRAPPVVDTLDIKRHGVRPYMTGINCVLRDQARGPQVWRDVMADVVMGQHLRLSGQFVCVGIQAPIATGDNLEFDNLALHIEGVVHLGSVNENGERSFRTILQVSHGVDVEPVQEANRRRGASERESQFAGINPDDSVAQGQTHVTTETN